MLLFDLIEAHEAYETYDFSLVHDILQFMSLLGWGFWRKQILMVKGAHVL